MPKKNKRFRIFAGPNGSGKTTLFEYLKTKKKIHTDFYVSADRIEQDLQNNGRFVFNAYRVRTSREEFYEYVKNHGLWNESSLSLKDITFEGGIVSVSKNQVNSYVASFITGYLVEKLIDSGQSFCYETVLSHPSKKDLIINAGAAGYKVYLYYVYTDLVELNVARVNLREKEGGHGVPVDKIKSRYANSIQMLPDIIELSDRAFIIDNSFNSFTLAGEKDYRKEKWYEGYTLQSIVAMGK